MTDRELIENLLSALEYHTEQTRPIQFSTVAIEVAREHLRKPAQQEPEWYHFIRHGEDCFVPYEGQAPKGATALYTSPPAQRKPLTDDQIAKFYGGGSPIVFQIIRDTEAAHGIKVLREQRDIASATLSKASGSATQTGETE